MWYLVLLVPPKIFISTSIKAIFFFHLPVGHPAGLNGFVNGCIDLTYVEGLIDQHPYIIHTCTCMLYNLHRLTKYHSDCFYSFSSLPGTQNSNRSTESSLCKIFFNPTCGYEYYIGLKNILPAKTQFISCKSFSGCHYSIGPMPLRTAQVGMEFFLVTAVRTGAVSAKLCGTS